MMTLQQKHFYMVIGLVCLFATSAMAVNPFDTGPYPLGWWDQLGTPARAGDIATLGGNVSLGYLGNVWSDVHYLDAAQAAGVRVIVNIPWETHYTIVDLWVDNYKDHPAVAGYNIIEEHWYSQGVQLPPVQARYDSIKAKSDKPVFITFTPFGVDPAESGGTSIAVQWKSAYDQFLVDNYHTHIGEPEFSRLEDEGRLKDFKDIMTRSQQASIDAGKPWWAVLSGWGSAAEAEPVVDGYRLPTYDESRFATYWALTNNPVGILHFAAYRTFGYNPDLAVVARPAEPYPYDGLQWLTDVYAPQTAELNLMGDALKFGKIANFVTDDTANVRSDLYVDPGTGTLFLVTLNETFGNTNTTFDLNLPPELWAVTRLFEGGATVMPLVNGEFVDTFSDFEVHVYLLSAIPPPIPGDVNLDGQVDGLDLTFLGAYWQVSGTQWTTGDLNGDGTTNGLDLNIVGENWQVGVLAPGENIPEPTALALLSIGAIAMLRRRQKTRRPDD
jgi:hypothetical protein